MSLHLEAKLGEVAETVLMPGDPLRAKHVADNFLDDVKCYNQVRGMLGFTGFYKGKRVSVQGSGMGLPSLAIYTNELIDNYGVKNLYRIGSCGSFQKDIGLRDVILAMSASTDSSMNKNVFKGMDYAPTADWNLLLKAHDVAKDLGIEIKAGNILSSDCFYNYDPEEWKLWAEHGVLAVEMESTALYTIAARKNAKALSILTVSDSLVSGEQLSAKDRQTTFNQMVEIALNSL